MTAPKRRVGNPLGDSKISQAEESHWAEAHHFAQKVMDAAECEVGYTEAASIVNGLGEKVFTGAPRAYEILTYAIRLWQAEQAALCLRRGRLIEREKG